MAIVFPFVLLLTVAVIQASMWYYARQIALTAAREGLSTARSYQAGPAEGAARARDVLTDGFRMKFVVGLGGWVV
ncbi:TadE family protein, partial [Streptomyces sp. NPDC055006]